MPTNQDETLQQRYAREHQDYLKLCGSMTAEQVADLQLQLNNALAGEDELRKRLTSTEQRNAELLTALLDAATSLETIAKQAGRDEFMEDMLQVRGYAESRSKVALAALKPTESGASE